MRRRTTHEADDAPRVSEQHARSAAASAAHELDALGLLAGDVAHDLNNALTVIEGYSELLLDGLEPGSPLRHEAEQIRRAAQLASPLPRRLLAIGRPQTTEQSRAAGAEATDLTVLLAEDEEIVREFAATSLERAGHHVVPAASGVEAVSLFDHAEGSIDVVVADMVMPGMSGSECAAHIHARHPETPVVLISGYAEGESDSGREDACAFLQKPFSAAALVDTVAEAASSAHRAPAPSGPTDAEALVSSLMPLTQREREVLTLLAEGMTNERAAATLGISPETVQTHVRKAMAKLDADTRTQAVATALRRSLIS
jgi:DNA-binding NarL/FixJ family response regulator